MEKKIKQGLKPKTKDERDLKLGAIFNLPKLSELPDHFVVGYPTVKDQGDTDFCTAFATCAVSELQEGVELSPEWLFAVAKEIENDIDSWGLELRTAMKAHVKKGCIEQSQAEFTLKDKPADFLKRIENWSVGLLDKALYHKKESYFAVTGPYDDFDNIRASMFKFKTSKNGVVTGLNWSPVWSIEDKVLDTVSDIGFGHCMAVIGFTKKKGKEYLLILNSASKKAHDNGVALISREVINKFVPLYGAFMFVDIPREKAEYYRDKGIVASENFLISKIWFLEKLVILMKQVLQIKKKQ